MNEQTHERVKAIKQSFRLLMNGEASRSMRSKGLDYKLNWGVSLPHLREMAQEYGKDCDLAINLWKENIRECKILATLIMPSDKMEPEIVDIWMEQTTSQEMVELSVFNLYQYLDEAPQFAFRWMASDQPLRQLAGFQLLACLFKQGKEPNERGINEFLDQAQAALDGDDLAVKHAVVNSINHFCMLGSDFELVARKALPDYV